MQGKVPRPQHVFSGNSQPGVHPAGSTYEVYSLNKPDLAVT